MKTINIEQSKESYLESKQLGNFQVRYAFHRSRETAFEEDNIGQDYLVFRYTEEEIAFAVCDGVGLSYYGNIAAKMLGDSLTDFLWLLEDNVYEDRQIFLALLSEHLQKITIEATEIIENHHIPTHIEGLLREVLELKRENGSESTFICGKIKFSSLGFEKMLLAWMGDSRIRIWKNDQEVVDFLKGPFLTLERWSTKKGIIGDHPHIFCFNNDSQNIDKIQIYTDGLKQYDTWNKPAKVDELTKLISHSLSLPESDDITFFEMEVKSNGI